MSSWAKRGFAGRARGIGLAAALSLFLWLPALTVGQDYNLESWGLTAGGGVCQSASYQVTDQVRLQGASAGVQSSADYIALPLVAVAPPDGAGIEDWMLYQ